MENKKGYRVIYQDLQNNNRWAYEDLDTLEQARRLEKEIKEKDPNAKVFLRQFVVVTAGGKTLLFVFHNILLFHIIAIIKLLVARSMIFIIEKSESSPIVMLFFVSSYC